MKTTDGLGNALGSEYGLRLEGSGRYHDFVTAESYEALKADKGKLIAALRDVLRDRLTQTNLHQMPPAIRARVEAARNLLRELGEE